MFGISGSARHLDAIVTDRSNTNWLTIPTRLVDGMIFLAPVRLDLSTTKCPLLPLSPGSVVKDIVGHFFTVEDEREPIIGFLALRTAGSVTLPILADSCVR